MPSEHDYSVLIDNAGNNAANVNSSNELSVNDSQHTPENKKVDTNVSYTAGTDIFSSDATPTSTPSLFAIQFTSSDTGILTATINDSGGTDRSLNLNDGFDIPADTLFKEFIWLHSNESLNLQHDASATITYVSIEEISTPA